MLASFDIDRRQLPALDRIAQAVLESFLLHVLVAAQPIFEEQDSIVDEMPFELRDWLRKSCDWSTVQKPMTRSTPARLYQLRSNSTISP